ncbi:unnamed protein product [Urochloa decumbens]|uniref:Rx N-terminal domain-containing protein n=1 Tax=Urochloa decumbens TaxID=240449 RepID=A0ABC9D4H0_9POAL
MAAEQIISSATSAVTGELARILFSGLVGRLDNRQPAAAAAAAADKKLRRLELLLIKIHSVVEASEKHPIENAWLVKWRDKFKEVAAEGDEVLAGFGHPAMNSAQAVGDAQQQQQQQENSSSATSAAATASATTTGGGACASSSETSSGMVYGIRGTSSEDIERLNRALEKLEELSPEIGDFIKLLKVEILALESKSREKTTARTTATKRSRPELRCCMWEEEEERNTLSDRLEKAYATICWNLELADGRDLRGHEWLAHWASILVEAKGQGCAVLGAISARHGAGAACEEVAECGDDREDSELGRFVCGMESLAGEADYFVGLALLCPWGGDSCRLC